MSESGAAEAFFEGAIKNGGRGDAPGRLKRRTPQGSILLFYSYLFVAA
jgi:hypothetical protein